VLFPGREVRRVALRRRFGSGRGGDVGGEVRIRPARLASKSPPRPKPPRKFQVTDLSPMDSATIHVAAVEGGCEVERGLAARVGDVDRGGVVLVDEFDGKTCFEVAATPEAASQISGN
jgi:hypothetical protein